MKYFPLASASLLKDGPRGFLYVQFRNAPRKKSENQMQALSIYVLIFSLPCPRPSHKNCVRNAVEVLQCWTKWTWKRHSHSRIA